MLRLGKILGLGKAGAESGGILNLISEKTGKISFRRSIPILIITGIVTPDVIANGLSLLNLGYLSVAGAIYVLPEILKSIRS